MNSTMLPSLRNLGRTARLDHVSTSFRQPTYECKETQDGMQIVVYIPGVDASGIEIEGRGADLTVTAQKAHFVRVNFGALNLEGVQRDYLLRLRLGTGFDYANMAAEVSAGVLTIRLPKRTSDRQLPRMRRAA
jgi:HSP20 family protein